MREEEGYDKGACILHPAGTSASLIQMEPNKHAHTVEPKPHLHGGHQDVVFMKKAVGSVD